MRPQVTIPKYFPRFYVPGYEQWVSELRELYWIHYDRIGDEPLPTLWDEWPSLHINHIQWHDMTFSIQVTHSSIDIRIDNAGSNHINDNTLIYVPDGCWLVKFIDRNDKQDMIKHLLTKDEGIHVSWNEICRVIFEKCMN